MSPCPNATPRSLPLALAVSALALAGAAAGFGRDAAAERRDAEPAATAPASDEPTTWSEQIVVTASRGERETGEVPFHVTIVDPLAISAATDVTAADLVAHEVPSLNLKVANSSLVSAPRDQALSLRGVGGGSVSRALLLVDGLPMLDPYNLSAIWSKVPLHLIERVEVVPGGGATVWGNLALSGVVNLITRAPADGRLDVAARLAEHATATMTASYAALADEWGGWAAVDALTTDGYTTTRQEARGAADEAEFRDYGSLTAEASYAASSRSVLRLRALGYREERGEGTPIDRAENEEWMASAALDLVAGRRSSWALRAFARRQTLDDFTGAATADRSAVRPSAHIFDLRSENWGTSAVWNGAHGERLALSAGLDFQRLSVDRGEDLEHDGERFTERYVVGGEQQLAGGFVESRWTVGPRGRVQAAARFDAIRTSGGRSTRRDLTSGALLESEVLAAHSESTVNPSVGFVFQATPVSRLRGAAYTGFRAPVPSELFVGAVPRNNRETAANPALEPERLVGGEIGYDATPSSALRARLTLYASETEDLIERITIGRVGPGGGVVEPCGTVGPNGSCTQRRNLGETRARGVEIGVDYQPHPRWRFELAAAVGETEIVDNPADPDLVGNEPEHTPSRRATLGIDWRGTDGLTAGLRVRHVSARWAEAENENRLDDHTLVDLSLARALGARLELVAGVENLLDEEFDVDFSSSRGFLLGPGRIYQLGVRYRSGG
ncbi:MAG TPA: TonB-dependent receptor [Thermoanaerobaculia bacterium]